MTQTSTAISPSPAACTCGAMDIQSCLCGTTQADWAQAQNAPAKKVTAIDKRVAFINDLLAPLVDQAQMDIALRGTGIEGTELGTEDYRQIAEKMSTEGPSWGRTTRWHVACQFAHNEIAEADAAGTLDLSTARWAVNQGAIWMSHAAE